MVDLDQYIQILNVIMTDNQSRKVKEIYMKIELFKVLFNKLSSQKNERNKFQNVRLNDICHDKSYTDYMRNEKQKFFHMVMETTSFSCIKIDMLKVQSLMESEIKIFKKWSYRRKIKAICLSALMNDPMFKQIFCYLPELTLLGLEKFPYQTNSIYIFSPKVAAFLEFSRNDKRLKRECAVVKEALNYIETSIRQKYKETKRVMLKQIYLLGVNMGHSYSINDKFYNHFEISIYMIFLILDMMLDKLNKAYSFWEEEEIFDI